VGAQIGRTVTDLGSPFSEPEGATPLGPDEIAGLTPTWIATRGDLDVAEHDNIAEAMIWSFGQKWTSASLLSAESMRQLHRRMFGDVWDWAGTLRKRETTIGVAPSQIAVQLRGLLEDTRAQIDAGVLPVDEVAIGFHHRLVQIRPFPNGNGRHARLAADLLVVTLGGQRFTWGGVSLTNPGEARTAYLRALRRADDVFDRGPLLAFARS
jgi:Fic-DOC domain mobile mystery protein B